METCYLCGAPWGANPDTYWPHRAVESLLLTNVPKAAMMTCSKCGEQFANGVFTNYVEDAYVSFLQPKIRTQLAELAQRGVDYHSLERTLGYDVGELEHDTQEQRITLLHVALHFILQAEDPVAALAKYRQVLNATI